MIYKNILLLALFFLAILGQIESGNTISKEKREIFELYGGYDKFGKSFDLYIAPFICGTVIPGTTETRYAAGTYLTSINVLALEDTNIKIQLSFNFPPNNQFESGVVTSVKSVNLDGKKTFTLDCSELNNNAAFERGALTTAASYISGYAIIESRRRLIVKDFISVSVGDQAPEIEVIDIKAISPDHDGYGQGQGSYGQGQNNYGYSQGQGQSNYGQGQSNYGSSQGQNNYGYGQGQNKYGYSQGLGSYGQGQGQSNYGQGQSNYGSSQGQNNYGYGQGQNSYGQGQNNYGK